MATEDKVKIFLVDDDKMFMESIKHSLSADGVEIKTFPTGEECLGSLEKEDPKVVVLDYYLNGNCAFAMNGIQVMNKIKHSNPGTEVIMLSSQDDVSIAVDTMKYGAYDYITKGASAGVKIKNDVMHILDSIEQADDFEKQAKRFRRISIGIFALVIIAFILNRIL